MTLFLSCITGFWVFAALAVWRARPLLRPLDRDAPSQSLPVVDPPATDRSLADWPLVSIIVPCRDEEAHVERSVESLLKSDYPHVEIVAVDDRSTDRTGILLDRLAASDSRLRVVHIQELAAGWLGKPHALDQGARHARGEWFLFTDADVFHHPELLRHTMARVHERELDLLTLVPHNDTDSQWMKVFFTQAMLLLILVLGLFTHVRRRQSWEAMGTGAFILVRRSKYDELGGHESLRLKVIDDVDLARMIKRGGGRTELALAGTWCRVPWATSVAELFRVTRKNAFAVCLFRWSIVVVLSLLQLLIHVLGPLLVLFVPQPWFLPVLLWSSIASIYAALGPYTGASFGMFLLHPLTSWLFLLPTWSSAWHVTRAGGVDWRGTFYSLAELRNS